MPQGIPGIHGILGFPARRATGPAPHQTKACQTPRANLGPQKGRRDHFHDILSVHLFMIFSYIYIYLCVCKR